MQLEYREQKTDGRFVMYCHSEKLKGNGIRDSIHTYNTFVRNKGKAQTVWLDETPYHFPAQTVLPLMGNQHFRFEHPESLVGWAFNRIFIVSSTTTRRWAVSVFYFTVSAALFLFHLQLKKRKTSIRWKTFSLTSLKNLIILRGRCCAVC